MLRCAGTTGWHGERATRPPNTIPKRLRQSCEDRRGMTRRWCAFALGVLLGMPLAVRWITRPAGLITPAAFAPLLTSRLRLSYRHPEALVRWAGIRPGWRVLDLGCGNGAFAPALARVAGRGGRAGRATGDDCAPAPAVAASGAIARPPLGRFGVSSALSRGGLRCRGDDLHLADAPRRWPGLARGAARAQARWPAHRRRGSDRAGVCALVHHRAVGRASRLRLARSIDKFTQLHPVVRTS